MSNHTSTTAYDFDWPAVRSTLHEMMDNPLTPATWEEMADAIEAHHDPDPGVGHAIEQAKNAGILHEHERGEYDVAYSFDPDELTKKPDEQPENRSEVIGGRKYAPAMVARDSWILYEEGEKQVKAPWKTGNLYNAEWGMQLGPDEYPETDFETAYRWARKAHTMNIEGVSKCEPLHPGFLLQREVKAPDENIVLIDLDDVRDPVTGDISHEAQRIIERANSYAEVSMSGTGVHIFVFGHLPETFPGERLVEDLHTDEKPAGEQPKVEIYHRRRIAITTGNHIEGTPNDVENGHDLIAELCDEYYEDHRTAEEVLTDLNADCSQDDEKRGTGSQSPYFNVEPATLLDSGRHRVVGGRVQGPHPYHGSSGGADYQSGGRNFAAQNGVWTCYRHGSGGNALHLVAVLEEYIECTDAGQNCLDTLSDVEFVQLCLDARDKYGFVGKPPYRALLGLAKVQGLAADSADRFDSGLYELLREMYGNASSEMVT